MGKSARSNRLGIVGDVSTPIFPSSALIDSLTVSESLTINTLPYPSSTTGVKSVLTSIDTQGDTKWQDGNTIVSPLVYRMNVDPQSNLDPNIGGLIVNSVDTAGGNYPIPLTIADQGLGMANPFVLDVYNSFTLNTTPGVGITSFTCRRAGIYRLTFSMPVLNETNNDTGAGIMEILPVGTPVLSSPPVSVCIASIDQPLVSFGIPIFNYGATFIGTSLTQLTVGDELYLAFALRFVGPDDSVVIPLTSNLTISKLV